jgi:hypothetical protein
MRKIIILPNISSSRGVLDLEHWNITFTQYNFQPVYPRKHLMHTGKVLKSERSNIRSYILGYVFESQTEARAMENKYF